MTTSIVSFNGRAINDGTVYTAFFRVDDRVKRRTVGPSTITPAGRHPILTATTRTQAVLPVQIRIQSTASLQDRQDELDKWLAVGTTGDLVVDFGDDRRRLECTVQEIVPYDGSPNIYTAVLLAPDARWKSAWTECYDAGGLKVSGNEITDTTRATGTEGDGASDVDRVGVWEGTTNIATNGGFESGTGAWITFGTNSIAVSTEQAKFGSQSLKCTVGNTNRMALYGGVMSASTTYSVSIQVYIPSIWTGVVNPAFTIAHTAATSAVDFEQNADVTIKDQWQPMSCRVTTDSSVADVGVEIGFPSGGTATQFIYLDGLQIEALNHPTPYVETDGSTDSRSDARVRISTASLDETQSWVAFRARAGFTEDPSGTQVHPPAYLFHWYDDANNRIELRYDDRTSGTGVWRLIRRGGGSGSTSGAVSIMALETGQDVTVVAAWTASGLQLSVDGSAFATLAEAFIPALSATLADIGSEGGTADHWDGDVYWFAAGTGTLTDADAATIAAYGNAYPDTWPDAADHCLTWVANDLATDTTYLSVENIGSVPATDAVLTIQPLEAKAGTDDWIYKTEVILANRAGNGFGDYAIEVTGGGWDHGAEVAAGRSLSSGDDVRLIVGGEQRARWSGGSGTTDWDQTGTLIWGNFNLSPGLEAELLTAIASGGSPAVGETIEFVSGSLAGWPASGTLLIGDEAIDYSTATLGDSKDTVVVVSRGTRNTTAAAHSAGVSAFWVEHRVQLVYGHTGAATPDSEDHRKPLITLSSSSNLEHVWTEFSHDTEPRSMQWARVRRVRDSQSAKMLAPGGEPTTAAVIRYSSTGPKAGKPAYNGWLRPVPSGTRYGASNHPMTVSNLLASPSIVAQFYGIDADGSEVALLNEGLGVTDVNASTDADDPDAALYSMEISARNGIVVASPGGEYNYDTLFGIDISSTDGRVSSGTALAQRFTVPEALSDVGYIDKIAILARSEIVAQFGANNTATLDVSIAQDDGAGGFVNIATAQIDVNNTSLFTNYLWYTATLSERLRVTPGDTLYVHVEWDSAGTGSPTYVEWYTAQASFEGLLLSHAMRIISTSLDTGPNFVGIDTDYAQASEVTIYYDDIDDRYPYVAQQAREDLYWLDGTLTNTTNGDAVSLEIPVATGDVVVVDVAARTVRNTTAGASAFNGATFTDPTNWFVLEPGVNVLTYVEDSVVSTRAQIEWSHRWES